jgi:fermentation-respiration switch protein FrsA (DUF1100 family)
MRALFADNLAGYTHEQRTTTGYSDVMIEGQLQMLLTPWFRNMSIYDPRPVLRAVKCPVLAVNGEKDLQVSAKLNLTGIAAALNEGGNNDVQIVELPGLNHLFQTCKSGLPTEYGEIQETFSPIALKVIGDWIRQRRKPVEAIPVLKPL